MPGALLGYLIQLLSTTLPCWDHASSMMNKPNSHMKSNMPKVKQLVNYSAEIQTNLIFPHLPEYVKRERPPISKNTAKKYSESKFQNKNSKRKFIKKQYLL